MLSPWIIIVNVIVRLATVCMLILRKCADYVIIIHTGHGDFGDKDIVHQAKVLCVVSVQKNLMLTPEVSSKGNVFLLV